MEHIADEYDDDDSNNLMKIRKLALNENTLGN